MSNNIKSRGFTIVEILIVIVVIAILATISIVAYNGIQNRAKTSSGASLSGQIAKKAEAYNTVMSSYPVDAAGFTHADVPEAKLDNTAAVKAYVSGTGTGGVGAAATYNNGESIVYRQRTGGACIWHWDFAASTPVAVLKTLGAATATTTAGTGCTATS